MYPDSPGGPGGYYEGNTGPANNVVVDMTTGYVGSSSAPIASLGANDPVYDMRMRATEAAQVASHLATQRENTRLGWNKLSVLFVVAVLIGLVDLTTSSHLGK